MSRKYSKTDNDVTNSRYMLSTPTNAFTDKGEDTIFSGVAHKKTCNESYWREENEAEHGTPRSD